jgi:diphosphomevalonate decarboxylase
VAPPDYWPLADVIAVVRAEHKVVGSTAGHALAGTSPLQVARVQSTPRRFQACKQALLSRDFEQLVPIVELEALAMHAVMLTSTPSLVYWEPVTVQLIKAVRDWRAQGVPVAFTIDAGPNVHCLCPVDAAAQVRALLEGEVGVEQVLVATVGGPSRLVDSHLF